ncbi:MAG: nuclear transport factor 2 family protein [Actinomycetota bacterium]
MAPTNIELVLRAFEAFNRGDWEAATNVPEDFVWINDAETVRMTGTPRQATGPDELREFWRAFFGLWDEWQMVPGEPVEDDSGHVFIPVHFSGRGKGSGVPIDWDYFHVWEFRDGRPAKISNIRDREAALAAAGLSDPPRGTR